MTKEQLEARKAELWKQAQATAHERQAHIDKANELQAGVVAAQGAIADCDYWLGELAKAEENPAVDEAAKP
jgi:hypothetical protein